MNSFQLLRIKILCSTLVWNKLPVNHTFKIPPDTQHYFGAEPILFDNDSDRLTGTEPMFRGVKVAVKDPFSSHVTILLNVSFVGLPIIRQLISTLRLVCWGVNSWATVSVWFFKCHNLAMYVIFWCTKLFWQPTNTFLRIFFQNCVYSQYPII